MRNIVYSCMHKSYSHLHFHISTNGPQIGECDVASSVPLAGSLAPQAAQAGRWMHCGADI